MKSLKYLFTLLLFFAVVPLFAQQDKADPVSVVDVKFKKIQANEIQCSEGQWTRIEVMLLINGNPDENANNQQWVRNIDVGLTLVYKDEKAKDKKSLDNLLVMKSKARQSSRCFLCSVGSLLCIPFGAGRLCMEHRPHG